MKKVIILILSVLLASCKTYKTTQPVVVNGSSNDTVFVEKHSRDSIYVHDSTFIDRYMKGDTIFITDVRWKTKYVERLKLDSIYVAKVDSIPVPYEVQVKVPASLSCWQKIEISLGRIMLFLIGMGIGLLIIKLRR